MVPKAPSGPHDIRRLFHGKEDGYHLGAGVVALPLSFGFRSAIV